MKCNACNSIMNDKSTVCQNCGTIIESALNYQKKEKKGLIILPLLLSFLCMAFIFSWTRQYTIKARENYDIVEQEQLELQQKTEQAIQETGLNWVSVADGISITAYVGEGTDVSIPEEIMGENVIAISKEAFSKSNITSVVIPGSVTTIGDEAFYGCSSLQNITLSEGLQSLGNRAFQDCSSLCEITLPSTVNYLGFACFQDASALTTVNLTQGNKDATIDSSAFESTKIAEIHIPGNYVFINSHCFQYCQNLKTITWDASIEGCSEQALGSSVFPQGKVEFHATSSVTSVDGDLNVLDSAVVYAPEGSYLLQYAQENGYKYFIE